MAKKKTSVSELINGTSSKPLVKTKEFDVDEFDLMLGGKNSTGWKTDRRLRINPAVEEALNVNGLIPLGHTIVVRGHSDTGKSTLLIETAKACQREGIFIVFLITEMKWDFKHLIDAGFEAREVIEDEVDELTGEVTQKVTYKGDFIYRDLEELPSIEAVASFIGKCLDAQKTGKLPRDIMFLWDSAGVVQSEQSIKSNSKSNQWDAGAMKAQFTNNICPRIGLTRKHSSNYFSTLFVVNHIWVDPQMGVFMAQPIMRNSGGDALWKQASIQITCGDITKAGTSVVKATSKGKEVIFGKITKIHIEKQHIDNGIPTKGKVIMTKHGMIPNTKEAIDIYKKEHSKNWVKQLGLSDEDEIKIVTDVSREDDEEEDF